MKKKNAAAGLRLACPALIGFCLFYAAPMLVTMWYSVSFGGIFVGWENYKLTFDNYMFALAVKNTLRFLAVGIPLIMLLSLGAALLLAKPFAGNEFYRLAFLYPMMVPVASTVLVVQIFLTERGVLNSFLEQCGLPVQEWLRSSWAFWVLIVLFLWKNIGYDIILLLTGIAMIPKEYEEMSRLDGTGKWQNFRYITLPLLKPMLFFTLLISVLNSFKCFREAFLIGGEYPHSSIYMIQHCINNNFANLNYTRISVISVVIFGTIFLVAGGIWAVMQQENRRGH